MSVKLPSAMLPQQSARILQEHSRACARQASDLTLIAALEVTWACLMVESLMMPFLRLLLLQIMKRM